MQWSMGQEEAQFPKLDKVNNYSFCEKGDLVLIICVWTQPQSPVALKPQKS